MKFQKTDPTELRSQIRDWAKLLATLPWVEKAFVFGSFARGSANVMSDLDIAVIIKDSSPPTKLVKPLKGKFPVDFLVFKHSEFEQKRLIGGVCTTIDDEGLEIYPEWKWEAPLC